MRLRTEREKMLAGESYNILDPDLLAEREKAQEMVRLYNLAETAPQRLAIIRELLRHVGDRTIISPPFFCSYGRHIYIGDHVYLNVMCTILDCSEVHIGHHVMIGPHVQIYTAAHHVQAEARNEGFEVAKPITIEDNVWIGGGAILLPGVTIGRNAVVGAGTVVTRTVPPNKVVAGNPARVIRDIEQ